MANRAAVVRVRPQGCVAQIGMWRTRAEERARRSRTTCFWGKSKVVRALRARRPGSGNIYEERYQPRYGFLRPIIPEVVDKFLTCADLKQGFARIRCENCKHEFILPYSCRQRYFCPSCHQKKVQLFGELLTETILYPVPHRHLTLGIPKMLRPYFRYERDLLKDLCRIAHTCLLEYLRATLDLPEGIPGIVMTIHSYGEYLDWHPHLHLLMADGLFVRSGLFYVLPQVSLKPMEELFRAQVTCPQCLRHSRCRRVTFLVDKGLLPPARANMLRSWVHSGFNVHRSRRVQPHERDDMQRLAHCGQVRAYANG